ncbi:MAG: UDP-glucuronate decarboxylase [Candidatus Gottesmanbacteria bacterium GW2011_GWA2_47_9]|uniref:UDP-glucuronate decarboxylase n=1 Tax=Candidatus Gottesmanbacteria bacterium GW2011_GWA2_47_9 TaxID=1618445 RepID=A0A0G1WEY7_9BACT|nr:MAG: UDP-glucuronate decarboxylase [Candidatus Gottesmanbacteria bacterium GW2011_GWA2_47_9]
MKKILVTGGAGFIGSHLCERLLKEGHEVICLDNLVTGDRKNIKPFLQKKTFRFVEADTRELDGKNIPSVDSIDEIYDLASPASVTYVSDHPVESATINSIGTNNLLRLAQAFHAKFLFASSSEAYGDPAVHPQPESYWGNVNPVGVRSGYDEGKRFGEALTMAYHREYRIDTRIIRIFNTYGPNSRADDSRIIPRFITQALRGTPLTVHGDGQQTRSFCYVSDMVAGFIKLMKSNVSDPVNIGNPSEYTVLEIAKKIIAATGSTSEIVFVNRLPDDPSKRKPDIRRAIEYLGWKPEVNFDEGLQKTIEYFKHSI